MIRKEEFIVREIAGEFVMMPVGKTAQKFSGLVMANVVSAFIWDNIENVKDENEMTDLVCEKFEVEREEAFKDVSEFLNQMKAANWIE